LLYLGKEVLKEKTIIFFQTKKQCHRMAIFFGLFQLKAIELHSDLTQFQRLVAFKEFQEGKFDFLMATDLASRGLDIQEVYTLS